MNKRNILHILAVFSAVCLCAVLCLSPTEKVPDIQFENAPVSEIIVTVDEAAAPVEHSVETPVVQKYTEEQLKIRFASMLNLNQCFNTCFENEQDVAVASALALFDYSADITGYGFCVNTCLVEGFAKSFYGIELTEECLNSTVAPNGYFAIPVVENGTPLHTVVSVTKNGNVYEVFSLVTTYYGGDDNDTSFAKSTFVADVESEFGFNLTSCEIL